MFLAPTFALNYGLSFAALTAAIVHTVIFHGKEIWYRFRAGRNQEPDIHMKMMAKYKECPDWWYGVLLVISVALGLASVLGYESQIPCGSTRISNNAILTTFLGWAFFVSIIVAAFFVVSLQNFRGNGFMLTNLDPPVHDHGNNKYYAM
jgi:hypothetical protein